MSLRSIYIILFSFYTFLSFSSVLGQTKKVSYTEQFQTAEAIYQELDVFLKNPSLTNIQKFKSNLNTINVQGSSKDLQLAKVIALCNLGFFEKKLGQGFTAIDSYKEAWNLFALNNLKGYDILNFCAIPLGNLYTQTNAYKEAEHIIEQYVLVAEQRGDTELVTSGIVNLSVVYQSQGTPERAVALLENGILQTPNKASLYMNLASAYYAVGDSEKALLNLQRALTLDPEMPNIAKLEASIYKDQGAFLKAETALLKYIKLLGRSEDASARNYAKAYLAMAEVQFRGNTDSFLNSIHSVYSLLLPAYKKEQDIPSKDILYAENTLIDALELHSQYYEKKGNLSKALQLLESAFVVVDKINHNGLLQGSRLTQQSSEKKRCERYLNLVYRSLENDNDSQLIVKGLIAVDRIKSKIATDNLLKNERVAIKADSEALNVIRYLERQEATLNNQIFYARRSSGVTDTRYLELLKAFDEVHSQLQDEYTQLDIKKIWDDSLNIEKMIQKLQNQRATYLNYFVGDLYTFQFVVGNGKYELNLVTSADGSQDELLQTCRHFNTFFSSSSTILNDPKGYADTAYDLYELLQVPEVEKVVISPDGLLSFIPFDALLTARSNTSSFVKKPYLLYKTEVSYTTSTKLYLEEVTPLPENPSILGLFPVFDQTDRMLKYSVQEAREIDRRFDTELLLNDYATKEIFYNKSKKHDILHLSTHASAGDFITPASLSFSDKDISVNLLYGEYWSPSLVVLSACETGVGKIISGEGSQSLARGFHYAGAKNILFSQWKVNDLSTALLMGSYYDILSKTRSRDHSLHEAKLQYLERDDLQNLQKSPYYWAGFVYYGATDLPEVASPVFYERVIIILAISILVLLFIMLLLKRLRMYNL